MKELNSLFATTLFHKIRERVVGKVSVYINEEDTMIIRIDCYNDIRFKMTVENFQEKIYNGYTSDYATYEVMSAYKKFILGTYFK